MHKKISSLSSLIEQLTNATKDEYKSIGVSLDIPIDDFAKYAHWSNKHYTRNCIVRESNFELILLCWEPGQETPVHCHGGEECWVYILDGPIEETHYVMENESLIETTADKLYAGAKSFMKDDLGFHQLKNKSVSRSISLHLYMDPIDECSVYNNLLKEFVPVSLNYHSYQGVLEDVSV